MHRLVDCVDGFIAAPDTARHAAEKVKLRSNRITGRDKSEEMCEAAAQDIFAECDSLQTGLAQPYWTESGGNYIDFNAAQERLRIREHDLQRQVDGICQTAAQVGCERQAAQMYDLILHSVPAKDVAKAQAALQTGVLRLPKARRCVAIRDILRRNTQAPSLRRMDFHLMELAILGDGPNREVVDGASVTSVMASHHFVSLHARVQLEWISVLLGPAGDDAKHRGNSAETIAHRYDLIVPEVVAYLGCLRTKTGD